MQDNIVKLHDYDGRLLVLYLELLPRSLVREDALAAYSRDDNLRIMRDISAALTHLESKGIRHRDLKPANIAYSRDRGAVLLDFGMAAGPAGTRSSGGTPWYLAPEFLHIGDTRGPEADVWALGITMLYTLGRIPLPDSKTNCWDIFKAKDNLDGADGKKMEKWLKYIENVVTQLDEHDLIHKVVRSMLSKYKDSRVTAKQVVARLQ